MTSVQELLIRELKQRKLRNPGFSMRGFAKYLGFSPAQLSQMMAGRRTITLRSLKKIGDRLDWSPTKKRSMISATLREGTWIETKTATRRRRLEEDQFLLISDWYHLAILSLSRTPGARPDSRWISRRLGISISTAQQALLRLERLGLIQIKPVFKQIGEPFEVVSEKASLAIRRYHKQNLELAAAKIESVPMMLRQFQSIALAIRPTGVPAYRKLIDEFLDQAAELSEEWNGSEVYHLNVQLFPVTQISKSEVNS